MLNYCRTYDERKPLEPEYPSTRASRADFLIEEDRENGVNDVVNKTSHQLSEEVEELRFAPPG